MRKDVVLHIRNAEAQLTYDERKMNAFHNQRLLHKISLCGLLLCVGFAATAQGTSDATEAAAIAEVKTEVVKAEEAKNQEPLAKTSLSERISGLASFYAAKFHGKRTASGEKFSSKLLTAAHLTLPFGTLLMVTNPRNNQSVIVRVNDRGPHTHGRLLDLSRAAAERLGITRLGVARVEIEVLKP